MTRDNPYVDLIDMPEMDDGYMVPVDHSDDVMAWKVWRPISSFYNQGKKTLRHFWDNFCFTLEITTVDFCRSLFFKLPTPPPHANVAPAV